MFREADEVVSVAGIGFIVDGTSVTRWIELDKVQVNQRSQTMFDLARGESGEADDVR